MNKERTNTPPTKEDSPRRLNSEELFAGQKRVIIEHDKLDYLLQITRQGKLILTK